MNLYYLLKIIRAMVNAAEQTGLHPNEEKHWSIILEIRDILIKHNINQN